MSSVRFWQDFVSGVIEVVSEDGVVDHTDPEKIDAWVGDPWMILELGAVEEVVRASFWTNGKDGMSSLHLFDKVFQIQGELADLSELGIEPQDSAFCCGVAVGKYLFGLRALKLK